MNTAVDLEHPIGIQEGLSNQDYHASPGLSFTGFKNFRKSPGHYRALLNRPKEQSPAQKLGTLVHMAILEPDRFAKETVHCEGPLSTNPWKKMADEAKASGKIPVGHAMWEQIIGMRDSVLANPTAASYIDRGKKELSAFWKDPDTGVLLRCRPDIWDEQTATVVDLKTCGDAQRFPSIEMMRNQYHIQSSWYLMGMSNVIQNNLNQHVHLVVETEFPHGVILYALNDASLERAMLDIRSGLYRYKSCLESDSWPLYNPNIQPAALSDWSWAITDEVEQA